MSYSKDNASKKVKTFLNRTAYVKRWLCYLQGFLTFYTQALGYRTLSVDFPDIYPAQLVPLNTCRLAILTQTSVNSWKSDHRSW